jgi:stage II sporulation protein D
LSPATTAAATPTSSAAPQPQPPPLFSGVVTAVPNGDGRIGVTPRNHRYRGVIEMTPQPDGTLRFVNQVGVETYLRGMGEVRNPNWPAASLQAQAIAARTYALRAMAAGGELCDTQRCQVYLGADAEYPAMDKAVKATAGQVLFYGRSLASAVYSANAGGHTATREEGFGLGGPDYPYLRAAPYPSDNLAPWSVTIALRDVANRLGYRGDVTDVEVLERGPSGRATRIALRGSGGDVAFTGIQFDAALGLQSTLFTVRVTTATNVTALPGAAGLQAPPEQAAALADAAATTPPPPLESQTFSPPTASTAKHGGTGPAGLLGLVLWLSVAGGVVTTRRRSREAWHRTLS